MVLLTIEVSAQKITLDNYKKSIIEQYYLFQKTEDKVYLDNILSFVKLNELRIKEDSIKSKVLYLEGVNFLFSRRFNKANEFFDRSLVLAKKTKDILLIGTIYNSMGVVLAMEKKDDEKAEEFYKKAIANYKIIKELPQQIDSYYNLTINARKRKKWKSSIEYANECIRLINKDKQRTGGLKRLYYFMADSNLEIGNLKEGLEYLEKGSGYIEKTDSYEISLLNKGYAKYYELVGNYKEALNHFKLVNNNLEKSNEKNEEIIKKLFVRELEFEKQLKSEKEGVITNQKKQILISSLAAVLFVLLTFVLFIFRKKNKKKNNQIKKLNINLKDLIVDLKEKNKDLGLKNYKIENLLKLNEQALFSRVLKITTYTDTIKKISDEIESYVDKNTEASSYLMLVNRKLLELISEDELWKDFKIQFEKIRPEFFNKLKSVAPNLSVNDLKHCTYIVSNLKSKEVAQLINVSPRSVETTRYRIKKKMGLERDENLYEALSSL